MTQNVVLIPYASAVKEIKELHHDKGREYKRKVSWVNLVLVVVLNVIVVTWKGVKHSSSYRSFSLAHVVLCLQIATDQLVVTVVVLWDEGVTEEEQN